jgi:hypothetical protein
MYTVLLTDSEFCRPVLAAGEEWTPFDFTMSRFLHGSDDERNSMFKLIPHCAKGSWVVSQSVGTTPVILGRKLVSYIPTSLYPISLSIPSYIPLLCPCVGSCP